jgi:2-isopropylmalate synthase
MKKIFVSDITLRAAVETATNLSFREKLNIAAQLERIGADAIELPIISTEKEDIVVYRTIAETVKNCSVCIPCDSEEKIEAAAQCIDEKDIIAIALPISTVQMEYTYHIKAPKMLEKIANLCKKAAEVTENVQFIARDASRAEEGFAAQCCKVACENGAKAVTLCDDGGVYFPEDYETAVAEVKAAGVGTVYVETSNKLNMAAASAVAALKAGADGVKTSAIGDEYLHTDSLADIIRAKGEALDVESYLDITAIHNIISGVAAKESAAKIVSEKGDGVAISDAATLTDIATEIKELGYELSDEDIGKVYDEFKRVTSKKGNIGTRELEAIIASTAMQVPSTYHVVNYVINSGNIITATANVTLEKNGETITGVSTGDGPIDAAFHAIEQIIGFHYELDDFQIQAVTKGREAIGSSIIRLRADGKLYSGNGVSTDIIGACIRAYINALNKIVYGEN